MKIRTRIAPSPTGFAHIGTIYQALFDYAWAKRHGGEFVIRIEDTDRERFVEGAEEVIYQAFDWFGLTENESPRKGGPYGPYRQSERLDIYQKYALELVNKGHAYWCDCSKERLEQVRSERMKNKLPPMYDKHCRDASLKTGLVIRMKIPKDEKIVINELVRGEIIFDSNTIDDQVLLKADGYPTYHLAVVVDDHLMQISHVIRGEEWLSSSPKHKLLYDYFGWEMPVLTHTPIIRNPDKSKMSKRHGHTSVSYYQEMGYLPNATLNYLALLGWKNPDQKDVFSLEEFVSKFDPRDLNTVGPVFDEKKLEWLSGEYIRSSKDTEAETLLLDHYAKYPTQSENINLSSNVQLIRQLIPLVKERIKKLSDFFPLVKFFYQPIRAELTSEQKSTLTTTLATLQTLDSHLWKADRLGEMMTQICDNHSYKRGDFFMTIRLALTGSKITPPLNESMEILGKEKCMSIFFNRLN